MTILVPIALVGWIVISLAMFTMMPPRRAALAAYLIGWLFLPQASIEFPGVPDLNKINATSIGALLGILMFDTARLMRYRFSWVDLPIIAWCFSSLASALANEAPPDGTSPLYDGISGVVKDGLTWAVPYLIGRLYFNDLAGLRELALAIVIGGLIYVPLCLYEIRMSPSLHLMVYGFHPSNFEMALRFGGYRPMVFMQHGLMVGMWMAAASLVAVWLWRTGAARQLFSIPIGALAVGLAVVTVMCKSTGAIGLLGIGLAVLFVNKTMRSAALLIAVMSIAPLYMFVRAENLWSGKELVQVAEMINEERADSVAGRLESEDMLTAKARQRPIFGWGGWGRWRIYDPYTGKDITVSDGMWVIALGERGLIGLASVTAFVLLPFALLLKRVPARHWATPWAAAPAALAMLLLLYSIDNLFNAMVNPVYFLAAGGLSGFYLAFPQLAAAARREREAWMQQQAQFTPPMQPSPRW